jgi:hypothetical protein
MSAFCGERNLDVIKMHGKTIKNKIKNVYIVVKENL